jgi:hypothetical protein
VAIRCSDSQTILSILEDRVSSEFDHNIKEYHVKMPSEMFLRSDEEPIFAFYRYNPSMGGAVLFTLLFMGTTFYHIFQMFKTRTWFFIPFVIGGLCMYYPTRYALVLSSREQLRLSDISGVLHQVSRVQIGR